MTLTQTKKQKKKSVFSILLIGFALVGGVFGLITPAKASASDIQKTCTSLTNDGNYYCYFADGSTIGYAGDDRLYSGTYPDTSTLLGTGAYQSSNINWQVTGSIVTLSSVPVAPFWAEFIGVGGDNWIYQFFYDGDVISQTPQQFNFKGKLADNTIVESPYKYEGVDLNDFSLDLRGNNPLNVYDSYTLTVSENNRDLGIVISKAINFSCTNNCLIIDTPLSDFGYTWAVGKTYKFDLSLMSSFASPIQRFSFIVGFNTDPVLVESNVCNPFTGTISTAFLNQNFSIENCARYIFVPSTSIDSFSNLINDIKQKPPFGWVTGIYTSLSTITVTGATADFTLETVTPITTQIFDPIRTALSWLFYFTFAFLLFNRFKHIQL